MSEIHDTIDERNIAIKNVGICDYIIPFIFKNKSEKYITIAEIKAGVSLDSKTKGAHLSRIITTLDMYLSNKTVTLCDISNVCKKLSKEVGVNNSSLKINFRIVVNTKTPRSNNQTNLNAEIELYYKIIDNKIIDNYIKIGANGAMLCPNSKAKSRYGAHSQKCKLYLTLFGDISSIDIKKIYLVMANSTSAPVFGVVRSEDEIYMTELAYDNPKFSEDAVRDLIISVKKVYKKGKIKAELINYESIHQHNVFCESDFE